MLKNLDEMIQIDNEQFNVRNNFFFLNKRAVVINHEEEASTDKIICQYRIIAHLFQNMMPQFFNIKVALEECVIKATAYFSCFFF